MAVDKTTSERRAAWNVIHNILADSCNLCEYMIRMGVCETIFSALQCKDVFIQRISMKCLVYISEQSGQSFQLIRLGRNIILQQLFQATQVLRHHDMCVNILRCMNNIIKDQKLPEIIRCVPVRCATIIFSSIMNYYLTNVFNDLTCIEFTRNVQQVFNTIMRYYSPGSLPNEVFLRDLYVEKFADMIRFGDSQAFVDYMQIIPRLHECDTNTIKHVLKVVTLPIQQEKFSIECKFGTLVFLTLFTSYIPTTIDLNLYIDSDLISDINFWCYGELAVDRTIPLSKCDLHKVLEFFLALLHARINALGQFLGAILKCLNLIDAKGCTLIINGLVQMIDTIGITSELKTEIHHTIHHMLKKTTNKDLQELCGTLIRHCRCKPKAVQVLK